MLMFFDILALDEEQVLALKQHERRRLLERVIRRIPGRADLAKYQVVRFSSPGSARELRNVFAKCITTRGEGLVMKPADEPYFDFQNSRTFRSCCIKLKKEAFGAFGDVGDFAIIGAAYDPVKAKTYRIPSLQWTDFYIGCLENKDDILRAGMKPRFVVVTTVSLGQQIMEALVHTLHIVSLPYGNTDHFNLRIENGINQGRKPSVIFTCPPVVDIRCFAFDKEGNTGFWTMRFPTVTRLHADRTFLDTMSFVELQQMAEIHKEIPKDEAKEELRWIKLLETTDPRGVAVDASTQYTSSSAPTPPSPMQRLVEDSGQSQASFFQEDNAERQQQDQKRDILIVDTSPLIADRVPSSTDSVESPMVGERRSSHLATFSSSCIQNAGLSSKRTRLARSESPVQRPKRQKVSDHPKNPCPHSTALDKSAMTQSTLSHPLSDITFSSLNPRISPKLENISEAKVTQAEELTKGKSYLATRSPYPTPSEIDGSSNVLKGMQATKKFTPSPTRHRPVVETDTSKGNGVCQQASGSCFFINCSFLLAPSVAAMSQLTEDLLHSHGAPFILDPSLWLDSVVSPRRYSFTRNKTRKLVLIEPSKAKETVQIFKAIQDLNLVKGDGKREWVEVYDFGIVECVTRMEFGKSVTYDIWRHFWIGAA